MGGANCSTTGDLLCDTPADPFGLPGTPAAFGVDCSYSGTLRDANGDLYHPPTDNIMSYYYPDCLTNLTMGQYDRIVGGLQIRQNAVCPADLGLNSYDFSCPSTTLTAPNNLLVSKTSQRINLTWVDNSVNELGFIIERSLSQTSDFKAIAGVAPNVTSYSDTTAISGNTYYYRLKASNTTNNYSSIAILAASNCPINQNLSMEVTGGSTLLFSASSAINSTSSISGVGTNVTYKASSIELNVGFGVEAGSLFESFVQPCSSSNLRESAEPIMVKMEESSGNIYAYPNPSRNKEFIIEYELAEPSFISLSLINFMGQQMKTIVDNQFEGNGIHHVFVEAKNLDAGNYICVLKSSKETKIKRIIID
ncbi:3-coathanger stack domain-containing protein [Pseudarcicella hirudinis]|uniref:zinc-dependent metalloprotease n=1 Tax=Pseudarcicella hirudinis TaxID=1079859 RepID=UPI0035E484F7